MRAIRARELAVEAEKSGNSQDILFWTALPVDICSYEHEIAFAPSLGPHITQIIWKTSADGIELMESTLKTLKAALEAIRDTAVNAFKSDWAVAGGMFDAMGMQRLPVYKAFYQACYIGNCWQMPPMQKYGVSTYS